MNGPVDNFQQDLFDLCKSRFMSMIRQGMPIQEVQSVANNSQIIMSVALQRAVVSAMVELGIIGSPVTFPGEPPQPMEPQTAEEPGPEEGEHPGNPFV